VLPSPVIDAASLTLFALGRRGLATGLAVVVALDGMRREPIVVWVNGYG
jgi:hypothetical protein